MYFVVLPLGTTGFTTLFFKIIQQDIKESEIRFITAGGSQRWPVG